MIHPSKLKNQIFGDASKMFETSIATVNRNQRPLPVSPAMGMSSQIAARATDTNINVALQRLHVYKIS